MWCHSSCEAAGFDVLTRFAGADGGGGVKLLVKWRKLMRINFDNPINKSANTARQMAIARVQNRQGQMTRLILRQDSH